MSDESGMTPESLVMPDVRKVLQYVSGKISILVDLIRTRKPCPSYLNILVCMVTTLVVFWAAYNTVLWYNVVKKSDKLPVDSLAHLRMRQNLDTYLDEIGEPLVEPEDGIGALALIVLVSSPPANYKRRQLIRDTWGRKQPTFFFYGTHGDPGDDSEEVETLIQTETAAYADIVLHDFIDVPANAAIKTALMLRWCLFYCYKCQFVMKVTDDVLVNPWQIREVIRDHGDAQLIGHKESRRIPTRDAGVEWIVPQWLYSENTIPEVLLGAGYIIKGDCLPAIYSAAFSVGLVRLEDVYWTYLVAVQRARYILTDDRRLAPYKPMFSHKCRYWHKAIVHNLNSVSMLKVWKDIKDLGNQYDQNKTICDWKSFYGLFE